MTEEIITGGITIPEFSTTIPAVTGDLILGSQTITGIDSTLIRLGQGVSGTGIPSGTTVTGVVIGGIGETGATGSVQLSNPASQTTSSSTLYFSLPDGQFYIQDASYINIPGLYTTANVVPGFLIYNNALDASSLNPLAGIFDRFVITEVTDRTSSVIMSFFCEYDAGNYALTGRLPQSAIQNAISSPTPNKRFSKLVAPDIGYEFQAGSVASQYNVDVQDVDDVYPTIIGPTGQIVTPGATGIQFTGAGVLSVTEPQPGVAVVTIEGGGGGVTGATGYLPVFDSTNSVVESRIPLYEDSATKRFGIGTTGPARTVHIYGTGGTGVQANLYIESDSSTSSANLYLTARATGPAPVFDAVGAQIGVDPTTDPTGSGRSTLSITVNNGPTGIAGVTGYGMHIKPRQSNAAADQNQGVSFGQRDEIEISRFREIAFTSDSGFGDINPIAQNSVLSLFGSGTGYVELRTDRGGTGVDYNHLFIRDNSIASFKADFQVFSSVNENAAITIEGAVQNVLGTTVLLGTPTITSVNNSISGFSPATAIGVTADSDRLRIGVTVPQTSYIFGKNTIVDMGLPFNPPPVVLAATGIGETSFTANWEPYPGAVVYLLDVSDDPAFSTFIYENEEINAPSTSYVVIGLQPNTTYYYRVRASTEPISSFDADYQAVLDYATTQSYTLPSAGQQILQNQLVLDLKAAGIWSKLDTLAIFATDGSSDFALIDWKRLSLYTAVNSPTFTSNGGFTGNGTSSYIDSNFRPTIGTNNYILNNAGRFFWVDNRSGTVWEGVIGNNSNESRNAETAFNKINQGVSNLDASVTFNVDEFHAINRTSLTNVELFTNTTQYSRIANSLALFNANQVILRGNLIHGGSRFRFYGMGASLVSENTDFYNAINTYLTSI